MVKFKKRLFGSDLDENIKRKLYARQQLAGYEQSEQSYTSDIKIDDVSFGEAIGDMNFDGKFDLSSRTPFARMWTAVQIYTPEDVSPPPTETKSILDIEISDKYNIANLNKPIHEYTSQDAYSDLTVKIPKGKPLNLEVEYEESTIDYETVIYTVGDNSLNTLSSEPNSNRTGNFGDFGEGVTSATIAPGENQTNKNEFMKPQAGITSISSNTEGPMGSIKRTTINFIVHNFIDFDKIYSRFFLKPGAQIFIDFGWDTSQLYNPKDIVTDDNFQDKIESKIADAKGDLEILVGHVVNYDAKIKENGSVECSVEIYSKNTSLLGNNFEDKGNLKERVIRSLENEFIQFAISQFSGDIAAKLSAAN